MRDVPRLRLVAVVPAEFRAVDALRGAAGHRRLRSRNRAAARCSRCRCPCRAAAGSRCAPAPVWRSCLVLALVPVAGCGALAVIGEQLRRRRRARPRHVHVRRRHGVFQPGVLPVHGLHRRVAAVLLTCLIAVASSRWSLALTEGHGLFTAMSGVNYPQGSLIALGRFARQRRTHGRTFVRRRRQRRTPGFLIKH